MNTAFFLAAPLVIAAWLVWRYPRLRRVRVRALVVYACVMTALIYGALRFVAHLATATVPLREIIILLWFTIACRLAWEAWSRSVGQWGQRWVRWSRIRRRQGRSVPLATRLIRPGRAALTLFVFLPVFVSFVMTRRFKLADGQDPYSTLGVRFDRVRIPTPDGLMLDGWFVPERDADRTILICHGAGANKGNFVWFLTPLLYRGYNVLFFDFRAHGGSDGRTCTYGIRERRDVRAAVDWLKRERPRQAAKIVGLGSSQGAMALVLAAADDARIDAIILDSPFTGPRALALHHARKLPLIGPALAELILCEMSLWTGVSFRSDDAPAAAAKLAPRPLLVIHGDEDLIMPAAHAQRIYDAAHAPRDIWFGPGPHSNIVTTDPAAYGDHVFAFLDRHLGPARLRARRLSTAANASTVAP